MCSKQCHENQPLEFYCEECKVLTCHKCSVGSHNRHAMTDTQKAAELQRMRMSEALEKVKAEIFIYEDRIRKQTELRDINKNEILSAEKKMTDDVQGFIRDLREHERTMKAKFAKIQEAQQRNHAARLENFELVLTQLKCCIERGESILQRNISEEILQTNQVIVERCEELLNVKTLDIYKPPHVRYMVEKKVNILDHIVVSNTDPSLSLAELESHKEVREKTETNFTIVTRDSDGRECYYEDDQIKINISAPADDQLETEIKDTKDGKYRVTYTPWCAGQHRVEIQVNGQPLTGSPWVVQVIPHQYQYMFQFGSNGKEQGKLDCPFDIAVNDKSKVLAVADYENERIQMFRFDGEFLREVALENVSFVSLSFTKFGDLLACMKNDNNRLSLFNEAGQLNRLINVEHLKKLWYISVGSDGRIITCDRSTIKVLSPDGKDLLQFFSASDCHCFCHCVCDCDCNCDFDCDCGDCNCDCANAWCVVYHQNKFFVSFPTVNRVIVFNNAGEYLYDIGCEGSGDGEFRHPTGLAIDKFNHLIVCDAVNRRLQIFTLGGKYVAKLAGSFFKGSGLAFVASCDTGHLFVTDSKKDCIHVFS